MRQTDPWSSPVSVLIAEANRMNCQLIQEAFRRDRRRVSVAGSTVDIAQALSALKEQEPDVAIVSARLVTGPIDGFALVRNIHSLKLRTRIVMLLDTRDQELVVDAFRFGAHGVVFRDEPVKILTKCVIAVHRGQIWAGSLYLGYALDALAEALPMPTQDFRGVDRLTKRETDIAAAVAEGLSNREASNRLHLSENTVKNYLQKVFDKLGVSSRTELTLYWINRSKQFAFSGHSDNGRVREP